MNKIEKILPDQGDLQQANALDKIHKSIGNSTNNLLYIVVAEDPKIDTKCRYYATQKVDKGTVCVDIIGYEITDINTMKNWGDLQGWVSANGADLIQMSFPWSRVVSIRNVSYKAKTT